MYYNLRFLTSFANFSFRKFLPLPHKIHSSFVLISHFVGPPLYDAQSKLGNYSGLKKINQPCCPSKYYICLSKDRISIIGLSSGVGNSDKIAIKFTRLYLTHTSE